MAIKGIDRYENLSAVKVAADGSADYGKQSVRFGDFLVPPAVAWVTKPIGQSPSVRAEFEMRKGSPVCLSVTITATPKGRPVTTADLESLPGLERKGLDAFKAFGVRVVDNTPEHFRAAGLVQEDLVLASIERKSGAMYPSPGELAAALKNQPDSELEQVAAIYRDNINSAPVQAVQDAFDVSPRTAARRIKAARDRGFLSQTAHGRKRGQL